MINKVSSIFFLVLLFSLSACKKEEISQMKSEPQIVGVITLNNFDYPIDNEYIAIAEGSEVVEIRPQVSGILKSKEYHEGSYLHKGQLLFVIEPDSYNAKVQEALGNLKQAQAKLVQSKQSYNRISDLFSKNAVSRKDYDNAKAEYNSAKANVETLKAAYENAKIQLNYTFVRSPVSGFSGNANYSIGNYVTPENILTVINKVDPIYINFSIPDPEINLMRELKSLSKLNMTETYVELLYAGSKKFNDKGKIIFIDKAVNKDTGDIAVKAEFKNNNLLIMPGQFVKAKVIGVKLINTILVPQEAVVYTAMGSMVITVDKDNIAQYKKVDLGANINGKFIVLNGLNVGERIIIEGTNKVRGGSKVIPTTPDKLKSR